LASQTLIYNLGLIGEKKSFIVILDYIIRSFKRQFKDYGDFTTTGSGEGFYDESGNPEWNKITALSRTYAPFVAGLPLKMLYDTVTGISISLSIYEKKEIYFFMNTTALRVPWH